MVRKLDYGLTSTVVLLKDRKRNSYSGRSVLVHVTVTVHIINQQFDII